jgi:hypothetical protein
MSSGAATYMPSLFAAICFCRVPQASCWVGLMLWSVKRIVCRACSTAWPGAELKAAALPAWLTMWPPSASISEEKCQPPLLPAL